MEIILQTQNLEKKYGSRPVVKQVNMNICRGDIYGFVGENGAGKTTIIRLLTGIANVTSGTYSLFGVPNTNREILKARKKISAVVESPSLYLSLNAYDNLVLQCKTLGVETEIIDGILETVGLSYLRNDKKQVKDFSLGMRQRLGIAVALIGTPEFIILDEPMNGLDPEGIIEVRELILKLNKENNITFLISSHILSELAKVATKYGFIHYGQLVQEITAEHLKELSRKCIEVVVQSNQKANKAMDKLKIKEYKCLGDKLIRIYDDIRIIDLVKALDVEGMEIEKIYNRDENIEEYYMKLIGGAHHD